MVCSYALEDVEKAQVIALSSKGLVNLIVCHLAQKENAWQLRRLHLLTCSKPTTNMCFVADFRS